MYLDQKYIINLAGETPSKSTRDGIAIILESMHIDEFYIGYIV